MACLDVKTRVRLELDLAQNEGRDQSVKSRVMRQWWCGCATQVVGGIGSSVERQERWSKGKRGRGCHQTNQSIENIPTIMPRPNPPERAFSSNPFSLRQRRFHRVVLPPPTPHFSYSFASSLPRGPSISPRIPPHISDNQHDHNIKPCTGCLDRFRLLLGLSSRVLC